jgi:hypothetical protein
MMHRYSRVEKMATAEISAARIMAEPLIKIQMIKGARTIVVIHRLACCIPRYRTVGPFSGNGLGYQ